MKDVTKSYSCSLELAMDLVGGKWKMIILWHLKDHTLRFCELKKLVPAITQKMLTLQLRELEEVNLIARKVYPVVPPKVEYSLTEQGKLITPILQDLRLWSMHYAEQNNIMMCKADGSAVNC